MRLRLAAAASSVGIARRPSRTARGLVRYLPSVPVRRPTQENDMLSKPIAACLIACTLAVVPAMAQTPAPGSTPPTPQAGAAGGGGGGPAPTPPPRAGGPPGKSLRPPQKPRSNRAPHGGAVGPF